MELNELSSIDYINFNLQSLKYSCSTEAIYNPKLLNRMGDGIANIKIYGNIKMASLCFAPGPKLPLNKISDTEWILPDFTDDHFLKIGCLPFCYDYLIIELKEQGDVTITWDAYMLNQNLRKEIMFQSSKPHYTESKTRKFIYSTGTMMNIYDI